MAAIPLPTAVDGFDDLAALVNQYAGLSPLPGVFNFKAGSLLKTRLAFANVRKGLANAKIACIGDSTTRGQGSGTTTAQALNGWTNQLAANLAARTGLVCRGQSLWGTGAATLSSFDARVTLSAGWAASGSGFGLGGPRFSGSGAGTFLFAPTEANFDTCDLYFCNNATGSFTVNYNAGATLYTANTTSAFTLAKQSIVSTLGANVVNIPWVSGTPSWMGLDCYNSAIKQVSVWNMGWLGATTGTWTTTFGNGWDTTASLQSATIAQDLTIISLGINDWTLPSPVSPTQYATNLNTLINAAKVNGDVMLLTPFPSAPSDSPVDFQNTYIAQCYNVALAQDIPLIDTSALFNGQRAWVTGFYTDTKHLNNLGYNDVGAAVSRVLQLVA